MLLTNTLAAGSLMGLGDILQQSREIHKKPSKVRDWRRTGETEEERKREREGVVELKVKSLLQCGNRTINLENA